MSSIKDFELAQRIHVATYQLKTRIEELEAERDRWQQICADDTKVRDQYLAEIAALREVVKAADAYCMELDIADLPHHVSTGMLASECPVCIARGVYDAARAKVKEPQ